MTLACLCWALLLQTTAITGNVLDAETGLPLAGVTVSAGQGAAVETDAAGEFALPVLPGRHTLIVSLVGYALARRVVETAAAGPLVIALAPGTGTYTETVTVASDRFARPERGVGSQHVLGSAELQNLRGVLADDPMRAIQSLPGVVTGDDLRSEFSVRGSPSARNHLTVDGFPIPYLLHTVRAIEDYSSSGSVSMINSDILDDVALMSGAYPQRIGNRTGAQIDFRLRAGSRDRRQARIAVSGTNASAVAEGPLGSDRRGSWLVSARQSYLDLIIRQIDQGVQFGFSDAQAKVTLDPTSTQRVDLAVIAGRSTLEERDEDDAGTDDVFTARNGSAMAIAGWRRAGGRGVVSVRMAGAANAFSNTTPEGVRIDEGRDRQAALRVDGTLALGAVEIEGGADADWTRQSRDRQRSSGGRYRVINTFDASAVRTGGYVQARVVRGPWSIVPGVRADRTSLTGEATLSPWVLMETRLPAGVTLRGGAGLHQEFPGFEQVVGALASVSTQPMRAMHGEVSLEHRVSPGVRWQVTFYDREESDFFRRPGAEARLLNDRAIAGSRSAPFAQTLDGYARGVEWMVQRKGPDGPSGWVAYSYGLNRYRDRTSGETFDGDHDQRHTLNAYGVVRASARTSFSAKVRVGTNVPAPGYYRAVDGSVWLSASRNELRLPVYARVDLRANRTFVGPRRRLTVFAEVLNVLNRANVRFTPPRVNLGTRQVRDLYERMIPVVPSLGVLIEF